MSTTSDPGRHDVPPSDTDDDGYAWNYYGRDTLPEPAEDPAPPLPHRRRARRRAQEAATDHD